MQNLEWYNRNDQRSWPIDETATLLADDGTRLPHNILSDIMLRFPETLGATAFISSVAVSPHIVSVTLQATGDFSPLGTVAVPRPVDIGRHYAIEPADDGVAGWIVFGTGVDEYGTLSMRFSTPAQTAIKAGAARAYRALPVRSIGKLTAGAGLEGVVRLFGGDDIKVYKDSATVDGVLRDVIRIGLADKLGDGHAVLSKYVGSCGQRPESRNCPDAQPIEFINNVAPDCCGNITIEFRGCGDIATPNAGDCGVVVNCDFGLSVACISGDRLPDEDGRLPNEYDDQCSSISISL